MAIDSVFSKIERFLKKDSASPLLVDVQKSSDLAAIGARFKISGNTFLNAAGYCKNDEFPRLDKLINDLQRKDANIFLTGLTTFLKLKGDEELRAELESILYMTTAGHVVVLSFQCWNFLENLISNDRRLSLRIAKVNSDESESPHKPQLVFLDKNLTPPSDVVCLNGIHELAEAIESQSADVIYIQTAKRRSSFPNSLFTIVDLNDAFDILCRKDPLTNVLSREDGTPEQWNQVQRNFSSWNALLTKEFDNIDALDLLIGLYASFDLRKKWLYYIALKLYGVKNNFYLRDVIKKCSSYKNFIRDIYKDILKIDHKDPQFQQVYSERKRILKAIGNTLVEAAEFCRIVPSEEKDAIYYLTDNTDQEKEQIFFLLDKYGLKYKREELINILNRCYPDLACYLGQYKFKSEMLTKYFQDYKYQKVINKVLKEFDQTVKEQAVKREYNTILQARSSIVESIDRTGAQTYFTDAMGVEYLAFIMAKCHDEGLVAKVTVCRCELPSITCKNKDFWSYFETEQYPIITVSDLDEIKHRGKDDSGYNKTKLPIHLISELNIIDELLKKIKANLVNGNYSKAILVSDHGASRLAVIHETENMWEMAEKGVHSGRCCLKSEIDEQPEYAADADDYWVLANYDRFKGSRKANVEVHGGATLEEVTVPIIELTIHDEGIEVKLMPIDKTASFTGKPTITVSYKETAAIKIFITKKLHDVSIVIDGHTYDAEQMEDDNFYKVQMPEIRKAKEYKVDVYASGNKIASDLPLVVKKKIGGEKEGWF